MLVEHPVLATSPACKGFTVICATFKEQVAAFANSSVQYLCHRKNRRQALNMNAKRPIYNFKSFLKCLVNWLIKEKFLKIVCKMLIFKGDLLS